MSWIDKRKEFQARFDKLAQENVQGLITELDQALSKYVSIAGISSDPKTNPEYTNLMKLSARADGIKTAYVQLNEDIIKVLAKDSSSTDLAGLLNENGELQKQINKLEKIHDEMKVDVETAVARDELLRSRNTDVTRHKLFILNRPIRKGLIPYFWLLAILFFGVGLVIFRYTLPPLPMLNQTLMSLLVQLITDKRVLLSLLGSSILVILFLSLKIAGVFGK